MSRCLSLRSKQSPRAPTMANLTIRNLTITPLELKLVERFEGHRVNQGNILSNATAHITGFLNATVVTTHHTVPQGGVISTQDVSIVVRAFQIRETDIRAADPGREVIRLTFECEGHRYQVDIPSPSSRSSVMTKLNGAPNEYTAVYIPSGFLAIYSSANLLSWMRELRDEYPLSMLSIPGTHNSPTCHTALPSVRCQAVGVHEQLDNGVRFMDVRVSANPNNDVLTLVHSAFPISLTGSKYFADLLGDVYAFLAANPSEAIVMSVKREGTGKGSDQQLSRYLKDRYVGRDAARWFTEPRIPSLGESRGKIVLVRRFGLDDALRGEWNGRGWGIDAQVWPDNCEDGTCGSGLLRIQDFYEVTESTNIEKKIDYSENQLERAAEQVFTAPGMAAFNAQAAPAPPPIFVNFLSASNFFNATCWPERIAAKVNPAIIEYLCMRHGEIGKGSLKLAVGDGGTGIVITDWVGANGDWDLIRCIVGMNARLQLKQ